MSGLKSWISERIGAVRARQWIDQVRHRLSFIPGVYVVVAIILVQVTLLIDRNIDATRLPTPLRTTVAGARSVLTALAGGLITSITLLLSMMLITIQLASGQFSPRTLRDWLGDRRLQNTVGLALGTTVFALLALQAARSFGDSADIELTPHITTLVALALGLMALFSVVRSVDHVTHSVRIGSVSRRIATQTIGAIEQNDRLASDQEPTSVPATNVGRTSAAMPDLPEGAGAIETPLPGWVQQIDDDKIIASLPEGSVGYVTVALGAFLPAHAPVMWVDPAPADDDPCRQRLLGAFATGDSRTLQSDVAFGLLQLTDIAVRALSPGVNDPSTACDVIVQLGNVMLRIWEQPVASVQIDDGDRTIYRIQAPHEEHLRRAFDPIRRYGVADAQVLRVMVDHLLTVRSEIERRSLVGSTDPIDEMIDTIADTADRTLWSDAESNEFDGLLERHRHLRGG